MKTYIKIIFIISIMFNFSYSDTLVNIQELSIKEDAKSQYELGKIYRKNGEYKKAFEYFKKVANENFPEAQNIMGVIYENGFGIEKDFKKSFEWTLKSANQGYPIAQNNIGLKYEKGEGVKQDYKKAFEWYEKSANQGYPNAQNNLAVYYSEGRVVNKDELKAEELFKKACEGGLDYACKNYEMALNARGFSLVK